MEKERKIKTISLIALIVAVVGLTVAFASLSTTLTINGSGSIDSASWDVHFENLSSAKTKGSGRQVGAPSISEDGLTVQNINVALSKPKDEVEYTVDIKNDGTINAEITSIEKSTLTSEQEKYFEFTATYKDGTSVEESNVINAKDKEEVIIRVRFKDNINATDLPKTAQTINLSLKLNYVQSDNVKVTTTTPKKENYEVGDEFCLGSECFYVIKDNGTTVTALAKYNLLVGNTATIDTDLAIEDLLSNIPISTHTEGYGLQSSMARGYLEENTTLVGTIAFAPKDPNRKVFECNEELGCHYGYWTNTSGNLLSKYGTNYPSDVYDSNSLLYSYVQNYENHLKGLGKTSVSARLITYNELVELGCSRDDLSCESSPSFIYNTSYWTASSDDEYSIWIVASDGGFISSAYGMGIFDIDWIWGVRPVITINKNEI